MVDIYFLTSLHFLSLGSLSLSDIQWAPYPSAEGSASTHLVDRRSKCPHTVSVA